MSAIQDSIPSNGGDLPDSLDQLKLNENEPRLGPDGEPAPKTDEEYAAANLTLRAIVSSKEAGVIIGKGGKNVADLRDETGVKAGVSKVVQGVHDRVLTITGGCDAISRAYAVVARALLEGAPSMGMGGVIQGSGTHRMVPPILSRGIADKHCSHQAPDLSQPDGHDHRSARPEDQAHPGCVWRAHGSTKGDVTAVD